MVADTMAQELEEESERRVDPLVLLSHSWTVEAYDEEDAVFKAMERASLIPEHAWRTLATVEPVETGVYIVYNRRTGSSVMVRVTPAPEELDPLSVIVGRLRAPSPFKKYFVTFYPRTFRDGEQGADQGSVSP